MLIKKKKKKNHSRIPKAVVFMKPLPPGEVMMLRDAGTVAALWREMWNMLAGR